ncbi:MAG: MATE family efflux transporter [Polyangiales bacterium]
MSNTEKTAEDDPTRHRILKAPLPWAVLRFGAPLALAMVLQGLFNLVDQYLIAKLPAAVSDASLDALGICDMVAALGTILSYGVSTGTATLLARHKGAGDEAAVARVAWGSIGIVIALAVAFGAVGVLGADVIIHDLLGAKGAVRVLGRDYLRVILGGSASVFLMFQITSVFRALGNSRLPLITFAVGNVLNLFLAVLMVYGPGDAPTIFSWGPPIARAVGIPRMEVLGAAWATIIARSVACVVPLILLRRTLKVTEHGATLRPAPNLTRAIVDLAWPTSAQFVVRVVSVLFVTGLVHHAYTTGTNSDAGTAFALCLRFETMALFVCMGWGGCAQTFVGMCLGAGDNARAARAGWFTALYGVGTMALLAVVYRVWGDDVLRVFTRDAHILELALSYLGTVAPSYAFYGLAIVLGNAIVGAGATRLALRIDATLVGAVQVPLMLASVVLASVAIERFWFTIVVFNAVNAGVYALVYRRGDLWQKSLSAEALGEAKLAGAA